MIFRLSSITVACASLACMPVSASALTVPSTATAPQTAIATLKKADGQTVGTAQLVQHGDDIVVSVFAQALTPGMHGTHVHMTGACEAPEFKTAGGHWNPTALHHGLQNPQGHHAGDLPNMEVKADGNGALEFTIAGAQLSGSENALIDADGAALVIHAGPDDMMSDPAGNSGGRVACGVIQKN